MFGVSLVRFVLNIFPNWLNDLSLPAQMAGTLSTVLEILTIAAVSLQHMYYKKLEGLNGRRTFRPQYYLLCLKNCTTDISSPEFVY